MISSSVTNIGSKLEWFSSERGRNGDVTLYTLKSASYRRLMYMYLSQPPQGREIIRTERTPEERNGEINQEEANKPSQT